VAARTAGTTSFNTAQYVYRFFLLCSSFSTFLDPATGLQALPTLFLLLLFFFELLLSDFQSTKAFFHFKTDRRSTSHID